MEEQEILSKAAEAVIGKHSGIEINFDVEPKNLLDKVLLRLKLRKPKTLNYQLKPLLVGNRLRIAAKAVNFPKSFDFTHWMQLIYDTSLRYNEDLIYITAVCIQNDRYEPSQVLLRELKWLNDSEFRRILDLALSQLDMQSFIQSIILISGADVLSAKEKVATSAEIPD